MVWDYLQNKWSKRLNLWGSSITEWLGDMTILYSTSAFHVYDGSGFVDDTASIALKVAFPWFRLGSLSGYQFFSASP